MENKIKSDVIFWDFDGVIMDSNAIRHKGFELVLKNFPKEQVDELLKFHNKNGGLSRYVKFRYFFEQIRGEKITEKEVNEWASSFSKIMLEHLINPALLIDEIIVYIEYFHSKKEMHIVSGSDGNELRQICNSLGISKFFKSINGSPATKIELIETIISKYSYNRNYCILIGDSINDYDAARSNGIRFLAYNNKELDHFNS